MRRSCFRRNFDFVAVGNKHDDDDAIDDETSTFTLCFGSGYRSGPSNWTVYDLTIASAVNLKLSRHLCRIQTHPVFRFS